MSDTIFSSSSPAYLRATVGNCRGVRRLSGRKLFWLEELPGVVAVLVKSQETILAAAPYDERLRLPDRVRKMNTVKWMILAVLISLLTSICLAAQNSDAPKPAQSTDELRQQLEKILKDTHTNGVSVAIVHKDWPDGHFSPSNEPY